MLANRISSPEPLHFVNGGRRTSGSISNHSKYSNEGWQPPQADYTSHKKFSEGKQVHVGMEASKTNQTRWE